MVAPWSFGKQGEGKLERPQGITTSTRGEYIVADKDVVKVFNHNGKFLYSFIPEPGLVIQDEVTDHSDNLYVLFMKKVCVFDNMVKNNNNKSRVIYLEGAVQGKSVTVNGEQKVFVLVKCLRETRCIVRVYEADGQFVTSFGNYNSLWEQYGPFPTGGGGVIISDYTCLQSVAEEFDAQGRLITRVFLASPFAGPNVRTVHIKTNRLITLNHAYSDVLTIPLTISIYNKEHKVIYCRRLPERYMEIDTDDHLRSVIGATETKEGRIALLCEIREIKISLKSEDIKGVVYVV